MKAILLVLAFTLYYCNAQLPAASSACTAELKLSEKDVLEFFRALEKLNVVPLNMQCHVKCVMEKLGHLKGSVYDMNKAMKDWKELPELSTFKVTDPKVFANCKNEKGANDCETASKVFMCLRRNKAAK